MISEQLKAIVRRGYESKDLDYKAPLEWDETDKKSCCALVKDILALANTGGGFLVIGVAEEGEELEWLGLTKDQISSFDTSRVNRFLQNYADPPINCIVAKLEDDNMKFVVIQVPPFADTPHICQKDFPAVLTSPTLYIRTDNNESASLKSSSDFRKIVELSVRLRSDSMLESMRAILTGGTAGGLTKTSAEVYKTRLENAVARYQELDPYKARGYRFYREMWCHPLEYQTDRVPLQQAREAAERAHVDFRGWPFLFISRQRPDVTHIIDDGYETFIDFVDFIQAERVDFWRLHQDLFFYQRALAWEESYSRIKNTERWAEITDTSFYIAEGIHCCTKLYEGLLDPSEIVRLSFRLTGTENLKLLTTDPQRGSFVTPCVSRMPQIVWQKEYSLAEWSAGLIEHSLEACEYIFHRFNWENPNLSGVRDIIQKMFNRTL